MRQQVSYNYTDWLKAYGYIMSTNNTVCRNSVAQSTAKSVLLHHHTNSCRWLLFSVAHTSRTPSKPKSALCHSWVNRSLLFTRWIGSEVAIEIGIKGLTQVNEHYYYESVPIVHRPPVSDYESSLLMSKFQNVSLYYSKISSTPCTQRRFTHAARLRVAVTEDYDGGRPHLFSGSPCRRPQRVATRATVPAGSKQSAGWFVCLSQKKS